MIVGGSGRASIMAGRERSNLDQTTESICVKSDVLMIVRKMTFLSWTQIDKNTPDLMVVETDPGRDKGKSKNAGEMGKDLFRS
jgi:hypothetical protein